LVGSGVYAVASSVAEKNLNYYFVIEALKLLLNKFLANILFLIN